MFQFRESCFTAEENVHPKLLARSTGFIPQSHNCMLIVFFGNLKIKRKICTSINFSLMQPHMNTQLLPKHKLPQNSNICPTGKEPAVPTQHYIIWMLLRRKNVLAYQVTEPFPLSQTYRMLNVSTALF